MNFAIHFNQSVKRKIFLSQLLMAVLVAAGLCPHLSFAQSPITQYVNPFTGTGGHGHTFPGATLPFGMVQLSPDTRIDGSWDGCGGYHYSDSVIYGFSHTHLSGTGVSDYGDILLMPTVGEPCLTPMKSGSFKAGYASHFSHARESASPGYYAVHLDDDNIEVELTASSRVGMHKYTFPKSDQSNIILDLAHRDKVITSSIKVIDARHVEGLRRSKGWAANQVVYFAIEFSKQFNSYGIAENGALLSSGSLTDYEHVSDNIQAFFQFNTSSGESITMKIGLSAVSMEGARNNLERELPSWDFEQVRRNADATWNYMLSKIEVKGGSLSQKRIFYTALYHCMIAPNAYNDVDKNYRGRDGNIHNARMTYYTVFSLWDTYRALHPLLTILAPKETGDFIQSMLLQYEQAGRLPVWELSANETDCMIGYHSVSVIADAAAKGIKSFDYQKALAAMKASANEDIFGLPAYRENGCISVSDEGESVSKTLEYAYDDWCIAQMAWKINDTATYKTFIQRAQYWKNLFDPSTGFMRPKKNGNFITPFDPYEINFNYTEANAWQYRFAVQQDIEGLKKMMGVKNFETALDSLFSTSTRTSGREQPDITGMIGQYAHGNEPSHHMAYLYDYAGKPEKTQVLTAEIMRTMYHDAPDGLIGNEDCGQMSAWYVLSAMGFYPVTPGLPYYALGTPLFDTIKIHLDNQKTFTIESHHSNDSAVYIQSMQIDGRPTDTFYISQAMILSGKTITFRMGNQPPAIQEKWITAPPSSITSPLIAVNPVIVADGKSFKELMKVSMQSTEAGSKLFFTRDNSVPGKKSTPYIKPFSIQDNTTVKAIAVSSNGAVSKVVTAEFAKIAANWHLTYLTNYNPQYNGGSDLALMDNETGNSNFKNGSWQGWWGNDMQVIVDLGKIQPVTSVGAEFMQDQHAWILLPSSLEIDGSADGSNFTHLTTIKHDIAAMDSNVIVKRLNATIAVQQVRYLKFTARNYGKLPEAHLSAGGDAWIFCDELFIH